VTQKTEAKTERTHPWRDNIEAITVSIIIIVLFKYFILEAYKIPTGSMQPTLMGWDDGKGGGVFDRVLVDKFSFHYRDPERFEVVVFRYPLDQSKNFIKRVVGVGPESFEIRRGDLYKAPLGTPAGSTAFEIVRRPRSVMDEQLKSLDVAGEWRLDGADWRSVGQSISAEGPGRATFPRTSTSIRDHYSDGYPGKLGALQNATGKRSGLNNVGDVRVSGMIAASADCKEFFVELREGSATYRLALPGPGSDAAAKTSIRFRDASNRSAGLETHALEAWQLPPGEPVEFMAQNVDDLLELEVNGKVLLTMEVPSARESACTVTLATTGGGAEFTELGIARDIYYTSVSQRMTHWDIPEDHYLMLGDNTQDSSDGRDWSLTRYELPTADGEGEIVRGNNRPTENPLIVPNSDGKATVYLHDEFGERRVFARDEAQAMGVEDHPLVPRSLLRGRAVLVVWPLAPSLDVYRLKWVR